MGWCFDVSKVVFCSEKVVVIGVGFVGLGCVDILVCVGVQVDVFDCYLEIGGMLIFGIFFFKFDKMVLSQW